MVLHNLERLIALCRKRFNALPKNFDLEVPQSFWDMFREAYEAEESDKIKDTSLYAFVIENGTDCSAISSRWLLYAYAFAPFIRELIRYRDTLKPILENALVAGLSSDKKTALYKQLPGDGWEDKVDLILPGTSGKIHSRILESLNSSKSSVSNFERFLSDTEWWGQGKNFSRAEKDWFGSSVRKAAKVIDANSDRLPQVINAVAVNSNVQRALRQLVRAAVSNAQLVSLPNIRQSIARLQGGRNVIFYGAPGTGKSHRIREEILIGDEEHAIRTVFHADTQTGDFVGSFRPLMINGKLEYAFQPGPFTIALVRALNNPAEMHYLVIEEINRAPAAAVFGEIFQLLDRKQGGSGKYQICPSDPAHEVYLAAHVSGWQGKMMIPSNLSILASMNSSDQAVMPLDTAFKRRWRFVYIPVEFAKCAKGSLPLPNGSGGIAEVSWRDFAIAINSFLADLDIPEDRHLGPFFLAEDEITPIEGVADVNKKLAPARDALLGKLFMYLWDDVLRHGARNRIFAPDIRTYGQLVSRYEGNKQVFSAALVEKLELSGGKSDDETNESGQS